MIWIAIGLKIQFFLLKSIFYLDSFDFDISNPLPSQKHHLKEIEAAYDKLTDNSVVMIDDCDLPGGGKGKGVISLCFYYLRL